MERRELLILISAMFCASDEIRCTVRNSYPDTQNLVMPSPDKNHFDRASEFLDSYEEWVRNRWEKALEKEESSEG